MNSLKTKMYDDLTPDAMRVLTLEKVIDIDEKVDELVKSDKEKDVKIAVLEEKVNKLEKLAWSGVGTAMAAGAGHFVQFIPGIGG